MENSGNMSGVKCRDTFHLKKEIGLLKMSCICSNCKVEKPTTDFRKDATKKTGIRSSCKSCCAKSYQRTCCLCNEDFETKSRANRCNECLQSKTKSELYRAKKPVSKCATCDKQARASACKYCGDCADDRAEKRKRD